MFSFTRRTAPPSEATFLNFQDRLVLHTRLSWPWPSYTSVLFTTPAKTYMPWPAHLGLTPRTARASSLNPSGSPWPSKWLFSYFTYCCSADFFSLPVPLSCTSGKSTLESLRSSSPLPSVQSLRGFSSTYLYYLRSALSIPCPAERLHEVWD